MDYDSFADRARAALIMAAIRQTTVTYGELARAIDWDTSIPVSHHMKGVLDRVSDRCFQVGEPSLAVLVVRADAGEPGSGFVQGPSTWASGTRECFNHWRQRGQR